MTDGDVSSVQASDFAHIAMYTPSYPSSSSNIFPGYGISDSSGNSSTVRIPVINPPPKRSTGISLLKFSGKWAGTDGERCLHDVHRSRSKATF